MDLDKREIQKLARMWRKGNPHALFVGIIVTTENSMEFPQKIKNKTIP